MKGCLLDSMLVIINQNSLQSHPKILEMVQVKLPSQKLPCQANVCAHRKGKEPNNDGLRHM